MTHMASLYVGSKTPQTTFERVANDLLYESHFIVVGNTNRIVYPLENSAND